MYIQKNYLIILFLKNFLEFDIDISLAILIK